MPLPCWREKHRSCSLKPHQRDAKGLGLQVCPFAYPTSQCVQDQPGQSMQKPWFAQNAVSLHFAAKMWVFKRPYCSAPPSSSLEGAPGGPLPSDTLDFRLVPSRPPSAHQHSSHFLSPKGLDLLTVPEPGQEGKRKPLSPRAALSTRMTDRQQRPLEPVARVPAA